MFNLFNFILGKKPRKRGKIYDEGYKLLKGRDRNYLVVAFTGGGRLLFINPYEFMSVTKLKKYNRLMLQDQKNLWYILGINQELHDFYAVCDFIRKTQKDCGAEKLLFTGTSSGGYAALLAGHLLCAEYVHAFGPQTNIDMAARLDKYLNSGKSVLARDEIYKKTFEYKDFFNLRDHMRIHNGKTRYFIHYSEGFPKDRESAEYMQIVPGVSLFPYPYVTHGVVGKLGRDYLEDLFADATIENPLEIYKKYYPDQAALKVQEKNYPASETGIIQIVKQLSAMKPADDQVISARNIPVELSLDSMACLQLIVELENTFDVEIDMSKLNPQDLVTVSQLRKLVQKSRPRTAI